jgi:hypothetical protein
MTAQTLLLILVVVSPIVLFFGMLYGDYIDGDYIPPWQKKKDGVNSGAKFG